METVWIGAGTFTSLFFHLAGDWMSHRSITYHVVSHGMPIGSNGLFKAWQHGFFRDRNLVNPAASQGQVGYAPCALKLRKDHQGTFCVVLSY